MEAAHPLELESVTSSPTDGDKLVVRIAGRWRTRQHPALEHAILVVEADGRRHRFPAIPEPRRSRLDRAAWAAGFALPTWLGPQLEGSTSLRFGEVTMQLPEGSFAELVSLAEEHDITMPRPVALEREADSGAVPEPQPGPGPEPAAPAEQQSEPGSAALRAELGRRAREEAALRGQLTDAQAQLAAQTANRKRLEATHAELRRELEELRSAMERRAEVESRAVVLAARVDELQAELEAVANDREALESELARVRANLATSEVAREAAQGEAAGLRAELDRLGAELSQARQQAGRGELEEAESLLAEARQLRARMTERTAAG
jgi:hypothetical protein